MKEAILLSCGILGLAGFIISCVCVAMVAGFTRSTHTVQYVPHDNSGTFQPEPDVIKENEEALLSTVGRKKKPTVVEDLDSSIEEVTKSDINF